MRGRRSPREPTLAMRAVLVCIAALAGAWVTGCGVQSSSHPASRTSVEAAALDRFFPATGEQYSRGIEFSRFQIAAGVRAESDCLARHGLPNAPGFWPEPSLPVNSEYPDMALLAKAGVTGVLTLYPTPFDPGTRMPPHERLLYESDFRRCARSADPLANLDTFPALAALSHSWDAVVADVDRDPAVLAAERNAAGCSAVNGMPFTPPRGATTYEEAYLATAAGRTIHLYVSKRRPEAHALDRHAARTFVRCFGTVERLRDELRSADRATWIQRHGTLIAKIERMSWEDVERASKRFGVDIASALTSAHPSQRS